MDEFMNKPNTMYKGSARRRLRKLGRSHQLDIRLSAQPDDLPQLLEQFFELHRERWRHLGKKSFFASDKTKEFYQRVSRRLGGRGWLKLSALDVDGETVAVLYGILYAGKYYCLQSACGAGGRKLKAGNALMYKMIESLIGTALEFHFLRGSEPYKYQWGGLDKLTMNQCLWRGVKGTTMGVVLSRMNCLKEHMKRAKRSILGQPQAESA